MCKAVKSAEITKILDEGATSVGEVSLSCGAGTDCGCCLKRLEKVVADHKNACDEAQALINPLDNREAV